MANTLIFCFLIFSFLLPMAKTLQRDQHGNETKFSYDEGSYNGPERWGLINPQWRTCNTGNMQSPIDLPIQCTKIIKDWEGLQTDYKAAQAVIKNEGYYIEVAWEGDAGGIFVDGIHYNLQQLHWHHPSEHTLNGFRFELELHMVHSSANESTFVIGVLYAYGEPDEFLNQITPYLNFSTSQETEPRIINPYDVNLPNTSYYGYMGSLTTPPCTEGIPWMVSKEVKSVSFEQVQALRNAVDEGYEYNARPIQPRNERDIFLYIKRWIKDVIYP